jgi:hypothetical protein
MQCIWYGDHLDLIKWGVLLRLADFFDARRILQLAYYRYSKNFDRLVIDGNEYDIPPEVIDHFRCLQTIESIRSKTKVSVYAPLFQERAPHSKAALAFLSKFQQERCIVFLDPDIGLEPQKPTLDHVLNSEAREIWGAMKAGDVFAFFQHKTNMAGQPWVEPKQAQLADALEVQIEAVKIAKKLSDHPKAVIFYTQKTEHSSAGPSRLDVGASEPSN